MSQVKLSINLQLGTLEAEGDQAFVLKVFDSFREMALLVPGQGGTTKRDAEEAETDGEGGPKSKGRKRLGRKVTNRDGDSFSISGYSPKLDKSLDLSALAKFLGDFQPANNADHILLFAHFLAEKLSKDPCSIDQIYTCYVISKIKIPKAFGQAFIDARGKSYGFIDFTNQNDISITSLGLNRLNLELVKKIDKE